MKKLLISLLLLCCLPVIAEEVPESVKQIAPTLAEWGKNAVLIQAVTEQNNKKMTLDQIKEKDKAWMAEVGVNPFMKSLMENTAAKELYKLESSKKYFTEVFLMDNQGGLVAMTNKTSDYWQGDEAKFVKSFADTKGNIHIGKVKFDSSTQAYLVQVSVPVMENDKAIGALTIGINLDELEK